MTDFTMTDEPTITIPPAPRSIIPLVTLAQYRQGLRAQYPEIWRQRCREAFQNARTSEASRLFLYRNAVAVNNG